MVGVAKELHPEVRAALLDHVTGLQEALTRRDPRIEHDLRGETNRLALMIAGMNFAASRRDQIDPRWKEADDALGDMVVALGNPVLTRAAAELADPGWMEKHRDASVNPHLRAALSRALRGRNPSHFEASLALLADVLGSARGVLRAREQSEPNELLDDAARAWFALAGVRPSINEKSGPFVDLCAVLLGLTGFDEVAVSAPKRAAAAARRLKRGAVR